MQIPYDQLSTDALYGVIDSYINREGTDYGDIEIDLAAKRDQLLRLLKKGEVVIVFDPASESINLLPVKEYHQLANKVEQHRDDY